MKYFRYKTVVKDYTTLELVVPPTAEKFFYTEGLAGVTVDDAQEFLTQQHPECEVTELAYEEVKTVLLTSRYATDIDMIEIRLGERGLSQQQAKEHADGLRAKFGIIQEPEL